MRILIVESDGEMGALWSDHLERQGGKPKLVLTQHEAIDALRFHQFDVLVIDLMLPDASVLAISDYATYRWPEIAIIVVSASSFFSDGSIFKLMPNVRGFLRSPVAPDDLAAVVEHYGRTTPDISTRKATG